MRPVGVALLLTVLISCASSVLQEGTLCSVDGAYWPTCPNDLLNPTVDNVTASTADVKFTPEVGSGTAYVCVSTDSAKGTSLTAREEIKAGTGCTYSSGAITINSTSEQTQGVTGLTGNQNYTTYIAYENNGRGIVKVIMGPDTLQGSPIVPDYVVDPVAGNDANSGVDLANAWQTLSKVNSTVTTAGADVCLMPGTFNDDPLNIDWAGSSGDTVTVTGCYQSGGSLYKWDEGPDPSNAANLAVIDDTITDCAVSPVFIGNDWVVFENVKVTGDSHECAIWWAEQGSMVAITSGLVNDVVMDNIIVDPWKSAAEAQSQYKRNRIQAINIAKGTRITIQNSTIQNAHNGLKIDWDASYVLVKDNTFSGIVHHNVALQGDGNAQRDVFVRITGNTISGSIGSDGVQFNANANGVSASIRSVRIDNNEIYGTTGENGIDFKGAGNVVVERNVIAGWPGDNDGPCSGSFGYASTECDFVGTTHSDRNGGFGGMMHGGGGAEVISDELLIRENILYDNQSGIDTMSHGFHVVHNTLIANNRDYTGANSTHNPSDRPAFLHAGNWISACNDCTIANNIFGYSNNHEYGIENGNTVKMDGNLAMTDRSQTPSYAYGGEPFSSTTSLTTFKSQMASNANVTDMDGVSANACTNCNEGVVAFAADLLDPTGTYGSTGMDLEPGAASPAVDAAVALTKANGSGVNQTSLTVDDASYFRGDFGSSGDNIYAPGDYIIIGAAAAVQIQSVDLDTNVITLKAARTWSDNDEVWRADSAGNKLDDVGACDRAWSNICDSLAGR